LQLIEEVIKNKAETKNNNNNNNNSDPILVNSACHWSGDFFCLVLTSGGCGWLAHQALAPQESKLCLGIGFKNCQKNTIHSS
jgi:hypothetical protein